MGKIEEAIKKINTEVQKTPNNQYIALVGEHIIDQITTEAAAELVLAAEKTLTGALSEITGKARKESVGNVAAIADSMVYSWAREYFGLEEYVAEKPQTLAEAKKKGVIGLNLADFL